MTTTSKLESLWRALGISLLFILALALAGCNDDHGPGVRTLTSIVKSEIANNTSETAEPIVINDLLITDRDTTETGRPETL